LYIDQPFLEQNADVVLFVGSCRRGVQLSYHLVAEKLEVVVRSVTIETVNYPFSFDFHKMDYPLLHLPYNDLIRDLLLKTWSSGKL
jgi:hypothetical protein